ncbi:MAG: glycosyltransferase [Geobacteraceae bacterium]|nr:glycosyltransferase [Geobacteraceae bacterium]NTW80256.1 glycosyltransferase [Geobacteraceae bacterium]
MKTTKVTVLMPVYNGERYLREAIESILNQTFPDFEFLIINDGSTDHSVEIIASYNDPRIKLIHNEINLGLISTLNRGIDLAKGEYIARMDCDDVSLPERLEKQVTYLDENSACTVIAANVIFLDEQGISRGIWEDDAKTHTYEEIRNFLPKANCIAHPSIMIREETLKKYRYNPLQNASEDYDLWLRLCVDGVKIEKITEPLLKYRIHPLSITSKSNLNFPELKQIRTKLTFAWNVIKHGLVTIWLLKVFLHIFRDIYYLIAKKALHSIFKVNWHNNRDLFAVALNNSPFFKIIINISKIIGFVFPVRNNSSLFFFFPFCHVGGAEKVHASIVGCFAEERPWVFFTKKSANHGFLSLFGERARLCNMWFLLKYGYPVSIGVMAGFINRHKHPVVFGSNSLFYYLLLPYLKPEVRCIDLIHAFGGGSEDFSLPVAARLHARVAINGKTVDDLKGQYLKHGGPPFLAERVLLIENYVAVPERYVEKVQQTLLKILYVGRGSEEKRVHLVGRIAALCCQRGLPVEVLLVGDTAHAVDEADRPYCDFLGEIADQGHLNRIYDDADLLLLTSDREGFPMVIMEGMAHGVVPVSTDVGGIPLHLTSGCNGWLVRNNLGEEQIVAEMCWIIERMCLDRELLSTMSRSAYDHARMHFSGEKFCSAYRSLLLDS